MEAQPAPPVPQLPSTPAKAAPPKTTPPHVDPFRLYSFQELAAILGVSVSTVQALCAAGAPHVSRKSRPEWLLRFVEEHPDEVVRIS